MEELLANFLRRRVVCHMVDGTTLMGTIHDVSDGVVHISDSGIDAVEYVAITHVVRFGAVR